MDEDRQPGQSVGVEVAEDEHALAEVCGTQHPIAEGVGVRQEPGIDRAVSGAATNEARSADSTRRPHSSR